MTSREITILALRIFAIYLLAQAIMTVPTLAYPVAHMIEEGKKGWVWVLFSGGLGVAAIIAVLVMLWSLSNGLVQDIGGSTSETDTKMVNINEAFVLSVVGLFFVFDGAQAFVFNLVSAIRSADSTLNPQPLSAMTVTYLGGHLAKVIIGLTLILRASGWARLLRAIRDAGLASKPTDSIE